MADISTTDTVESFNTGLQMFHHFESYFRTDREIKEKIDSVVGELELTSRQINCLVDTVHLPKSLDIGKLTADVSPHHSTLQHNYQKLSDVVPNTDYYKYHNSWKHVTQHLVCKLCLVKYLECGTLLDRTLTAQLLGIESGTELKFHLALEDYLIGVLMMVTELARFAVNRVTAKDYERPLQVAAFVNELDAGFRLLNLKNDYLRKRYDALKYDVKKIEEVVYDVTIRGLDSKLDKQ